MRVAGGPRSSHRAGPRVTGPGRGQPYGRRGAWLQGWGAQGRESLLKNLPLNALTLSYFLVVEQSRNNHLPR